MTPFAKSFIIKRMILAGILGLIIGGFVLHTYHSEQANYKGKQADINSTELYKEVSIITFGDSLSAGVHLSPNDTFAAKLESLLRSQGYNVIVDDYSESGATTTQAMLSVSGVIDAKPDIVIVEFGANDALQELDMQKAQRNLADTVQALKDAKIKVLLAGLEPPSYLSFPGIDKDFYAHLAVDKKVMLYPNFMKGIFDESEDTGLLQHDRLHPTALGNEVIAENISPYVINLLHNFLKDNKPTENLSLIKRLQAYWD